MILFIISSIFFSIVYSQINLGTLNLGRDPFGQWNLGFNQGANLLGFGGDRGFSLKGGDQGFGLQTNGGALVGGERIGVDSGLGVDKQNGFGLGSLLSFGNTPSNRPGGQLQQFLENISRFFSGMAPPPPPTLGGGGISSSGGPLGSIGVSGTRPAPQIPSTEEEEGVNEGEVSKGDRLFPTLQPPIEKGSDEMGQIEENIDETDQITEIPVIGRTKNPRQLPGLIEMNPKSLT